MAKTSVVLLAYLVYFTYQLSISAGKCGVLHKIADSWRLSANSAT